MTNQIRTTMVNKIRMKDHDGFLQRDEDGWWNFYRDFDDPNDPRFIRSLNEYEILLIESTMLAMENKNIDNKTIWE